MDMRNNLNHFRTGFILLILSFTISSCFRLDDNLFNNSSLTQYLWDNYEGEVDFRLDSSYDISPDKRHLFTLLSRVSGEKNPVEIYALYLGDTARIKTDTVILYCHGNKDHMDFYWQRAKLLAHAGGKHRYGVMMMDYRGYGMSKGKPTEPGIYADVEACISWLAQQGLQSERLVIYGFSLGSAPACFHSANNTTLRPSKLMLEAPFASAEVMIQDASKLAMPASFFTDVRIDNGTVIKSIQQPFCWMHGTQDNFLSISTHGEVVYEHHKGIYKESHRIEGAGHSSVPQTIGFESYTNLIHQFIIR
jgi:pimeloyl-ACP methyl ester carboxylesterase